MTFMRFTEAERDEIGRNFLSCYDTPRDIKVKSREEWIFCNVDWILGELTFKGWFPCLKIGFIPHLMLLWMFQMLFEKNYTLLLLTSLTYFTSLVGIVFYGLLALFLKRYFSSSNSSDSKKG